MNLHLCLNTSVLFTASPPLNSATDSEFSA